MIRFGQASNATHNLIQSRCGLANKGTYKLSQKLFGQVSSLKQAFKFLMKLVQTSLIAAKWKLFKDKLLSLRIDIRKTKTFTKRLLKSGCSKLKRWSQNWKTNPLHQHLTKNL